MHGQNRIKFSLV